MRMLAFLQVSCSGATVAYVVLLSSLACEATSVPFAARLGSGIAEQQVRDHRLSLVRREQPSSLLQNVPSNTHNARGQGETPSLHQPEEEAFVTLIGSAVNKILEDTRVSASSNSLGAGHHCRLDSLTPWTPNFTDPKPWLQFDLGEPQVVRSLQTLGHSTVEKWTKRYKVWTRLVDTEQWQNAGEYDANQIFGNSDLVETDLTNPTLAQYVKIELTDWHLRGFTGGVASMRVELLAEDREYLGSQSGSLPNVAAADALTILDQNSIMLGTVLANHRLELHPLDFHKLGFLQPASPGGDSAVMHPKIHPDARYRSAANSLIITRGNGIITWDFYRKKAPLFLGSANDDADGIITILDRQWNELARVLPGRHATIYPFHPDDGGVFYWRSEADSTHHKETYLPTDGWEKEANLLVVERGHGRTISWKFYHKQYLLDSSPGYGNCEAAAYCQGRQLRDCSGRCSNDADCKHGLTCFPRSGRRSMAPVPGCKGDGEQGWGYCYRQAPSSWLRLHEKTLTQSTVVDGASNAVDDGDDALSTCARSSLGMGNHAWWRVDLGGYFAVKSLSIVSGDSTHLVSVTVDDAPCAHDAAVVPGQETQIACVAWGKTVQISRLVTAEDGSAGDLRLCDVKIRAAAEDEPMDV